MRGGGRRAVRGLAPQAGRKPRTARAPALVPSSSFPLLPPSSPPSSPLSWPKGGLGSQPRRVWRALSVRSCGPCWPRAIVRMRGSLLARVRAFAGARPLRRRRVVRPGRLCGRRMLSLCLCGAPVRLNRRPGAPGGLVFSGLSEVLPQDSNNSPPPPHARARPPPRTATPPKMRLPPLSRACAGSRGRLRAFFGAGSQSSRRAERESSLLAAASSTHSARALALSAPIQSPTPARPRPSQS